MMTLKLSGLLAASFSLVVSASVKAAEPTLTTPASSANAPAPAPAPVVVPPPVAEKVAEKLAEKTIGKLEEKDVAELKRNCDRHFPGQFQAEVRSACASAANGMNERGRQLSQTRCRITFGEESRLVFGCLIGIEIAGDLTTGRDEFKKKLQTCAEYYPVYTEIDAFLQESCLTGIYIPTLVKVDSRPSFETCGDISPEKSFIGPCAVGASLGKEKDTKVAPNQQNRACERYFDHRQFHAGYRACLAARGLSSNPPTKILDAIHDCSNLVSDGNSDTERAACLVGLSIYRQLSRQDEIGKRFEKCGENKVRYEDRDFLARLTAASVLEITADKGGAQNACKEVYRNAKNKGRGDCLSSLSRL